MDTTALKLVPLRHWLTAYLTLVVEVDGPVLEALSAYWKHVQATVAPLLPLIDQETIQLVRDFDAVVTSASTQGINALRDPTLDIGVLLLLMRHNGLLLRHIPKERHTIALCMVAVRQNAYALQFATVQTRELCLEAIRNKPATLKYVTLSDPDLLVEAVHLNPIALKYIPTQLRNYEMYRVAVQQNAMMLEYVPAAVQCECLQLCLIAVLQEGLALEYVCPDQRNSFVLAAAVNQNFFLIAFIPFSTPELLLTAATAYLKQVAASTPGVQSDIQAVINRVLAITNRVST